MPRHEEQVCPRCRAVFECKAGTALICDCSRVELTDAERSHIRTLYDTCLCAACLGTLKLEYAERHAALRRRESQGGSSS